jgi:proteasome assembly chaperone (PAC2) family protein
MRGVLQQMSTIDQSVRDVASLLNDPGSFYEFGCHERDFEKFIQLSTEKYPGKPYCLVRDWVLWDVKTNDAEMKMFEENSIKPVIVHARCVIEDQTGRTSYGHYRISTPLVEMIEPCFFVTRNTVYLLAGSGTRKTVNARDVTAVFYDN